MKLNREFYDRDATDVAKDLLGKVLVRNIEGKRLSGIIIETEAYMGVIDKASHAYGGRKTQRTSIMYKKPGISYVYFIYGLYFCFNIVTREEGNPQAVLVRGIKPLEGINDISFNRYKKPFDELSRAQVKDISNGPSKVCMALQIGREQNGIDLLGNELFVESGAKLLLEGVKVNELTLKIRESKRIGIDYAQEARDFLWRYEAELWST